MYKLLDETNMEMLTVESSCITYEEQITSIIKNIKQFEKTNVLQTNFINDIYIEIYNIHYSTATLKDVETKIHEMIVFYNSVHNGLSKPINLFRLTLRNNNFDFLRHRSFYEGFLNHLVMCLTTAQTKETGHIKMISQNESLLENVNKLKKEAETNRAEYNDLVCKLQQNRKK